MELHTRDKDSDSDVCRWAEATIRCYLQIVWILNQQYTIRTNFLYFNQEFVIHNRCDSQILSHPFPSLLLHPKKVGTRNFYSNVSPPFYALPRYLAVGHPRPLEWHFFCWWCWWQHLSSEFLECSTTRGCYKHDSYCSIKFKWLYTYI